MARVADLFLNVGGREVVITDLLYVRCDGGEGPLGHPVEYMTLEKGGEARCKYCDRRFVHTSAPAARALQTEPPTAPAA
jgi:uncharacterized Zn-finger protein